MRRKLKTSNKDIGCGCDLEIPSFDFRRCGTSVVVFCEVLGVDCNAKNTYTLYYFIRCNKYIKSITYCFFDATIILRIAQYYGPMNLFPRIQNQNYPLPSF
jgi:hypothetical protein